MTLWTEFHSCYTVRDNWKLCDFSLKITTNIVVVVVKLNLHSQYSSSHEAMLLLTCSFRVLTSFKCVLCHLHKLFGIVACTSYVCKKLSGVLLA